MINVNKTRHAAEYVLRIYCIAKKSGPILCNNLLYDPVQDFMDIQYMMTTLEMQALKSLVLDSDLKYIIKWSRSHYGKTSYPFHEKHKEFRKSEKLIIRNFNYNSLHYNCAVFPTSALLWKRI